LGVNGSAKTFNRQCCLICSLTNFSELESSGHPSRATFGGPAAGYIASGLGIAMIVLRFLTSKPATL